MKRLASLLAVCLLAAAPAAARTDFPHGLLPETWAQGAPPATFAPGEVTVVELWARWCRPCLRAMPHLEALWRELRGEGVHVLGLNTMDREPDAATLRAFLAKQPTPPTYPVAVDAGGAVAKAFDVKGIPHALVVREGRVVWQGHPASLDAETLRALRDNRPPAAKDSAKPDPAAETRAWGAQADAAAKAGDWARAVDLQRRALAAHPLAKRLAEPYAPPAEPPAPDSPAEPPAPAATTAQGDAAPYAALLGSPIPADGVDTFIAYWPNPGWIARLTWASAAMLPQARLARRVQTPHRVIVAVPAKAMAHAEALFAAAPWLRPDLRPVGEVDPALFGVDDRRNPPYVALFRNGRRVAVGSYETFPPDMPGLSARLADLFRKLRATRDPAAREAMLEPYLAEGGALPRGWGALLVPQAMAIPYEARDVAAGKRRATALAARFRDDPGALEMLRKTLDAWPELAAESWALQSSLAVRLAELNDRGDPAYAQAWFAVAAEEAGRAGDQAAEQTLLRRALEASPTFRRYRAFAHRLPALPEP